MLEQAEQLPPGAEAAKDAAEPEFEGLDMMKKAKALMAVGINLKLIAKIPNFIKGAAEGIKGDFLELKESLDDLKTNFAKTRTDAQTCSAQSTVGAVACYKLIFGPIKYTKAERDEWEVKMKERADKREEVFNPLDYPLIDMIPETAQA